MKKRFFQDLTGDHERVRFVACQFDVTVKDTSISGAHADVTTNPCGEKQKLTLQKLPFWRPWKRDIVHTKRLNLRGEPRKDTDDEDHGEHHGFHGAHLYFQLLRHHLLLERHGLLLKNWVPRKAGFVHDLANLPLSMTDVRLVHGVNEEVPNDGVQRH